MCSQCHAALSMLLLTSNRELSGSNGIARADYTDSSPARATLFVRNEKLLALKKQVGNSKHFDGFFQPAGATCCIDEILLTFGSGKN